VHVSSRRSSGLGHLVVALGDALVVALLIVTVLLVLLPLYRPD
jgi:hypothetical protein